MNETPLASRAGAKLEHGLDAFAIGVSELTCADFGCNVGGFTDCLLRRGASCVHAVDTGYGTLAYRLRMDERVIVRERTNALHAEPPEDGVDLVVIDLAWTRLHHSLPAAKRWLRPGGRIVALLKPHYEAEDQEKRDGLRKGALDTDVARVVAGRTVDELAASGVARPLAMTRSPVIGGKSRKNVEYLVLFD